MHTFNALIFDLDGTIANTIPLCIKAFQSAIEPLTQVRLTEAEIVNTFGPSEEGTIQQLVPEHYDQALAGYLHQYAQLHPTLCPHPFPGIQALLDDALKQGLRLGMVTGKGRISTDISLRQFGLETYFEHIETGQKEGPSKPAGLRKMLDFFQPSRLLYIGDAPSDVVACRQVGIPIAAAAWAETANLSQLELTQPDYLLHSIEELRDLLEL